MKKIITSKQVKNDVTASKQVAAEPKKGTKEYAAQKFAATVSKPCVDGLKHQSKPDAKPATPAVSKKVEAKPEVKAVAAAPKASTKWHAYTEGGKLTACTVLRAKVKGDVEDTLTHAEVGSVRYFYSIAALQGAAKKLSVTATTDLLHKMHPALINETPGQMAGHLNYALGRPGKHPVKMEGRGVKATLLSA